MRDFRRQSTGERILNWVAVPFVLVGIIIWWALKVMGSFAADVFRSFYGRLVTLLGATAFAYFIAYVTGYIK